MRDATIFSYTQHNLFRAAFDYAPIGMALVGTDGCWLDVNNALCNILGYTKEELLAKNFQDITHPDDLETEIPFVRQMLGNEIQTYQIEKRYVHKQGHIVWALLSVSLAADTKVNQSFFIMQADDITARKQAEEELKKAEERLQLIVKGSNDGLWDWNAETNKCFFSARWKEMLGYTEDEISSNANEWETRIHPDDLERVLKSVQEHHERKTPFFLSEYRMMRKDGSYKWLLDRGQALWDENGKLIRMAGSHTDITARREMEEELKEINEELRQASEQVKTLQGLLPICSYCKKIRDDKNYWQNVEEYITEHSVAQFSHGICPDCYCSHILPELEARKKSRSKVKPTDCCSEK